MTKTIGTGVLSLTMLLLATSAREQQPPPPCHPNPNANLNMATVRSRGDIRNLPGPLKDRLVQLAGRPHSQLPTQAYAEAHFDEPPFKPKPSQLFQYYLLDTTGFESNPFTSLIPGVNDAAMLTATGPDCGLSTVAAVANRRHVEIRRRIRVAGDGRLLRVCGDRGHEERERQ